MKKRMLSALLMLSLFFMLVTPAAAAAPTRPSGCPEGEYVTFAGSTAYSGQTWERLNSLREYAASGKTEISRATAAVLAKGKDAWDLFRVSNLAQWGYLVGFVTYEEALKLVEPAAKQVAKRYSSWDTAYKDYMTGYCTWAGLSGDIWQSERGVLYQEQVSALLDNGLFKTGVIGLSK